MNQPLVPPTRPRRTRLASTVALSAALLLGGVVGAHADPGEGSPPSQQEVDEARAKTALASRNVQEITAALDAADARGIDLARRAGRAAEQANDAKLELDRRSAAAVAAQQAAAA
ncbi:MAG: hypothetical protein KDB39_13925, partial [Austwickia sp.]|nr:hypothetical protein [Austwickia sp.]